MTPHLTPSCPESTIRRIRGHAVILDSDLAVLYGVTPKRLNEQVKRNISRFPADFMFQLSFSEWDSLRSQFATLKRGEHRKYLPYAFTEADFGEQQEELSVLLSTKHFSLAKQSVCFASS